MSLVRSSRALSAFATLLTALTTGAFAQTALPVSSYTSSTEYSLASGISDNGVICGTMQQTRNNPTTPSEFVHAAKWTLSGGSYTFLDLGQLKPDANNSGRWVPSWANSIIDLASDVAIVGNSNSGNTGAATYGNTPPGFYWTGTAMSSLATDTTTYFTWAYAVDTPAVSGTDPYIVGAKERTDAGLENGGLHTACYWTSSAASTCTYLGNLTGSGEKWAEALGSNGTVVVGHACEDYWTTLPRAVYWATVGSAPTSVGKPSGIAGSYSRLNGVKSVTIGGTTHTIAVGFASDSPDNSSAISPSYLSGGTGAYAYDITTSSFSVLPTPSGGYSTVCAVAINAGGVIVGSAYKQAVDGMGTLLYNMDGTPVLVEYACKWTPDGLGSYPSSGAAFLSAGSSFSRLIRATGINSSGTIVGMGDISSVVRAFVL